MTIKTHGCCRICHAKVALSKANGKVNKHWNKYLKEICEGSKRPPSNLEILK